MKYFILPIIGILIILLELLYRIATLIVFAADSTYSYFYDALWHLKFPTMSIRESFFSKLYFRKKETQSSVIKQHIVVYYTSITDYVLKRAKEQVISHIFWSAYTGMTAYELFKLENRIHENKTTI